MPRLSKLYFFLTSSQHLTFWCEWLAKAVMETLLSLQALYETMGDPQCGQQNCSEVNVA